MGGKKKAEIVAATPPAKARKRITAKEKDKDKDIGKGQNQSLQQLLQSQKDRNNRGDNVTVT